MLCNWYQSINGTECKQSWIMCREFLYSQYSVNNLSKYAFESQRHASCRIDYMSSMLKALMLLPENRINALAHTKLQYMEIHVRFLSLCSIF